MTCQEFFYGPCPQEVCNLIEVDKAHIGKNLRKI